ncbi:MAG: winged helix-turn-helix transcriptional regulator [Halocynthiibacter sp.]
MPREEQQIIRQILHAVEADEAVSQRALAGNLGISLGSVNWHLKRCVNKGLIKLQQVPLRRYLYYLTPEGFDEKVRLTSDFMRYSMQLFRDGRKDCNAFFSRCEATGLKVVALAGDGEFAEIAVLSGLESPISLSCVIDAKSERATCAGIPVVGSVEQGMNRGENNPVDAILLTDLRDPQAAYTSARRQLEDLGLSPDIVHVPKMFALSRKVENELGPQ